jgi:hypothetical protein
MFIEAATSNTKTACNEVIYLVGQISVDRPETYAWRQRVIDYFKDYPQFEIINPCNNSFNKNIIDMAGKDIYRKEAYKTRGIELLVPKDYSYVERSTMCIVNMNHYDIDKPIIGSFFELAWYYTMPSKVVVGIFNGDPSTNINTNHPFTKAAVNVWVQNEIEAAKLLRYYYEDAE